MKKWLLAFIFILVLLTSCQENGSNQQNQTTQPTQTTSQDTNHTVKTNDELIDDLSQTIKSLFN